MYGKIKWGFREVFSEVGLLLRPQWGHISPSVGRAERRERRKRFPPLNSKVWPRGRRRLRIFFRKEKMWGRDRATIFPLSSSRRNSFRGKKGWIPIEKNVGGDYNKTPIFCRCTPHLFLLWSFLQAFIVLVLYNFWKGNCIKQAQQLSRCHVTRVLLLARLKYVYMCMFLLSRSYVPLSAVEELCALGWETARCACAERLKNRGPIDWFRRLWTRLCRFSLHSNYHRAVAAS